MRIHAIDIERLDGDSCCGTMELLSAGHPRQVLWTVTWLPHAEVEVELYPEAADGLADEILGHRTRVIDALLDTVLTRSGREALPT
ncbi:MAG: hypothetical protein VKO21_06540 [Candidatus Sericytochromatia bacterium]|nr:hypothetical protein [Candidatus Sericytochromatia bacterium]